MFNIFPILLSAHQLRLSLELQQLMEDQPIMEPQQLVMGYQLQQHMEPLHIPMEPLQLSLRMEVLHTNLVLTLQTIQHLLLPLLHTLMRQSKLPPLVEVILTQPVLELQVIHLNQLLQPPHTPATTVFLPQPITVLLEETLHLTPTMEQLLLHQIITSFLTSPASTNTRTTFPALTFST